MIWSGFLNKYSLSSIGINLYSFVIDAPGAVKFGTGILGLVVLYYQALKSREQYLQARARRKKEEDDT